MAVRLEMSMVFPDSFVAPSELCTELSRSMDLLSFVLIKGTIKIPEG